MNRTRDPRTKEELLDRMLSFDFDGDIRHLGKGEASLTRLAANRMLLSFKDSGKTFELSVHIPRGEDRPQETRSFARSNEPPFPHAELEAEAKETERQRAEEERRQQRRQPRREHRAN